MQRCNCLIHGVGLDRVRVEIDPELSRDGAVRGRLGHWTQSLGGRCVLGVSACFATTELVAKSPIKWICGRRGFRNHRRTIENNDSLKLTTGVGSRCAFAIKYAPCREYTIKEASSGQLVPARSSCALTAAVRQYAMHFLISN